MVGDAVERGAGALERAPLPRRHRAHRRRRRHRSTRNPSAHRRWPPRKLDRIDPRRGARHPRSAVPPMHRRRRNRGGSEARGRNAGSDATPTKAGTSGTPGSSGWARGDTADIARPARRAAYRWNACEARRRPPEAVDRTFNQWVAESPEWVATLARNIERAIEDRTVGPGGARRDRSGRKCWPSHCTGGCGISRAAHPTGNIEDGTDCLITECASRGAQGAREWVDAAWHAAEIIERPVREPHGPDGSDDHAWRDRARVETVEDRLRSGRVESQHLQPGGPRSRARGR